MVATCLHARGRIVAKTPTDLLLARSLSPWPARYSDVANTYGAKTGERILDTTSMVDSLRLREKNEGLWWNIATNPDGTTKAIFMEIAGAKEIWQKSKGKVAVLDTKACTNRLGMKLALLVTTDENGVTRILAATLLDDEEHDNFEWIFQEFEYAFGSAPAVLFTDGDKAMAKALKSTWPRVAHLLCTYHLWKNFHQHIKPLFTGKGSQAHWRVVSKKWWAICKNSDERDCEKFSGSWKELTDYIDANATAGEDKASALQCVPSPSPSRSRAPFLRTPFFSPSFL